MARPRVLLTGFGPFPGVADNPSGWLAEALAARPCGQDWDIQCAVLPTEWEAIAALAPRLHADLQPHVMIHFGVSARARKLQIERVAHNRAEPRADACGAKPSSALIAPDGAARLETRLPVSELADRLRTQGHAARASHSCGRYLCNYLYYHSLDWARRQGGDALFVHVPLTRIQGGDLHEDALLHAAEDTLRFVLAIAHTTQTGVAHPVRPAAEAQA